MLPLAYMGTEFVVAAAMLSWGLRGRDQTDGASQQPIDISVDILPRRGSVVVGYSGRLRWTKKGRSPRLG
jgi:hypothetical protein